MIRSKPFIRWIDDPHGCRADAEQEAIDELYRAAHENGECGGLRVCGYCLDELDEELDAKEGHSG